MNNKGAYTSGIVFVVSIVGLLLMTIIYTPILTNKTAVVSVSTSIDEYIETNNDLARLYTKLYIDEYDDRDENEDINDDEDKNGAPLSIGPIYIEKSTATEIPLTIASSTNILITLTLPTPNAKLEVIDSNGIVVYKKNFNNSTLILIPERTFLNGSNEVLRGDYMLKIITKNKHTTMTVEYIK